MENSKICVFFESSQVFSIWFHLLMPLMTFDRQNRPPRTLPGSFWIFNLSSGGQPWQFWDLILPKMEYFAQKLTYTSPKWMTKQFKLMIQLDSHHLWPSKVLLEILLTPPGPQLCVLGPNLAQNGVFRPKTDIYVAEMDDQAVQTYDSTWFTSSLTL